MAEQELENPPQIDMQAGPESNPEGTQSTAKNSAPVPSDKNINQTIGGKISNFFTFYVIGFFLNVAMSLFITYGANPRPGVKDFKERVAKSIAGLFGKSEAGASTLDGVRSAIEISFMMIAGTIAAGIMTPLLKYHENIAYKLNKMLGKDTEVVPDKLQKLPEPKTVEERIQREIDNRVKKDNNSIIALWLSRFSVVGGILAGDGVVNRTNRMLENGNLPSIDTLSWGVGKQLYKVMPKKAVEGWDHWFDSHGAGLKDIKASSPEHYARLQEHGKVGDDNSSMVISEQSRLVIKEMGWSYVAANFVERLTNYFREKLTDRQVQRAIKAVTDDGLVPEGHRVIVDKHGKVSLDKVEQAPHELDPGYWAAKEGKEKEASKTRPAKQESYTKAVTESRAASEGQQASPR